MWAYLDFSWLIANLWQSVAISVLLWRLQDNALTTKVYDHHFATGDYIDSKCGTISIIIVEHFFLESPVQSENEWAVVTPVKTVCIESLLVFSTMAKRNQNQYIFIRNTNNALKGVYKMA